MLDLGLSKMALIGAVALIVIGPEKLPRVARTVGSLLGRAQRYVADVKAEVNRSMELDELRKMKESVEAAARDVQTSVQSTTAALEKDFSSVSNELKSLEQQHSSTSDEAPWRSPYDAASQVVPSYQHPGKNFDSSAAPCRAGTNRARVCAPMCNRARPAWRGFAPKSAKRVPLERLLKNQCPLHLPLKMSCPVPSSRLFST